MTKTEKLKQAYAELKQGKIVEFIPDEGQRKLKNRGCRCWIQKGRANNRNYIYWNYFGESANEMSFSDLRWIAKVIGNCTTYDYRIVSSVYGDQESDTMKKKVVQITTVAILIAAAFIIGKETKQPTETIPEGYIKLDDCIPLEDVACYFILEDYPCFELKDFGNQLDEPSNRSYKDIMNTLDDVTEEYKEKGVIK